MDNYIPSWLRHNECCCNCVHNLPLQSHPWVNGLPCTQQVGWVCVVSMKMKGVRFAALNKGHGFCELYTRDPNGPACERTQRELDEMLRGQKS